MSERSHCEKHRRKPADRPNWSHGGKTTEERGYGWRWRQMAKRLLRRHPVCQVCTQRLAVEVDHIIPLARGGRSVESNAQSICADCHKDKTTREGRGPRISGAISATTDVCSVSKNWTPKPDQGGGHGAH